MAISAAFTINTTAVPTAKSVAYGATVTLQLTSSTGCESIVFSVEGTSRAAYSAPSLSLSGTPLGSTATFTMPSDPGDGLGVSYLVKCTVSNSYETKTAYGVVGAVNSAGFVPIAAGEQTARSATHGWAEQLNGSIGNPNGDTFKSTTGAIYSTRVVPDSRLAYSASLANSGTLNCDFPMSTNNRLSEIYYTIRVGDYKLDCLVVAKRNSGGTVSLITPATPKQVITSGDYASAPAITLAASISGTNVRVTLTNSSGSAQTVAMSAVSFDEDIS